MVSCYLAHMHMQVNILISTLFSPLYCTLVWQGTKFALSLSAVSGYRYLGDGGTDRRKILHDGTYR